MHDDLKAILPASLSWLEDHVYRRWNRNRRWEPEFPFVLGAASPPAFPRKRLEAGESLVIAAEYLLGIARSLQRSNGFCLVQLFTASHSI